MADEIALEGTPSLSPKDVQPAASSRSKLCPPMPLTSIA